MFKNNLRIAWRNLVKDRQFTFLNLVGLSTGLACAFLVYLWVSDELSVDKFNSKDSRLYQAMKTFPGADGSISTFDVVQGLVPKALAEGFPEVEYAVPVRPEEIGILSSGDKHLRAKPQFVTNDFFKVFSYRLIQGNRGNPIAGKYGALISDKLALKLFNTTQDIIGRTIAWSSGGEFDGSFTVAGVFEAPPSNASVQFDFLLNYTLYTEKETASINDWSSNNTNVYVLLKKGTDIVPFNAKIKDFLKSKNKAAMGADWLKWEGDLFLQRYSDRYLYNKYENGVQAGGRIEYVRLFSIIAIFILLIACINFMNLSTAKASGRIKEVGIKKVVGASRRALIFQYLGESVLMATLSLVIAMLLVSLLLPAFREITGRDINLHLNTGLILAVSSITLVTGLIAGSYPALYLSGFRPAMVLKGKLIASAGESWVRRGLVVFQFSVSVVLIIAVMVVYQQMNLIQTKNLGYDKENVIRFSNEGILHDHQETFLAEIKNIPGVKGASSMDGDLVGNPGHVGSGIDWEGKYPGEGIEFSGLNVDYGFASTLGLKMAAGHSFDRNFGADSTGVIFNEAAVSAMRLRDPVGKTVTMWGKKKHIIGVVKDFHFESFYKKMRPFFLSYSPTNTNLLVKIKAGQEKETLGRLEKFYKSYNLGLPFEYKFLDEDYQALYASEQRVAILSRYFAALVIIISCLGLFGLAAFTARKRQKEIGIRKVIGASVRDVVLMLSGDFLRLVLISVLIAFPIAWWAMNRWLLGFAYRVPLNIGVFMIAGASVIIVTLLTISFQSVRAGLANPVKSLRSE